MTTVGTVAFQPASFTWSDGAFVLTGRWSEDAAGLGRVRLLVDVDGRQRNIGAQGGKTAGGEDWRATFICAHAPDAGAPAVLKAGAEEIPLPPPELAPAPASAEKETVSLIEQLRAERAALDQARQALARERKAAEEVEARLSALRRRGPVEPVQRAEYEWLGYAVAGAIAVLFLLVLIWLL